MAAGLRPGQLVTTPSWFDDDIELYASMPGSADTSNLRVVGRIVPHDVALVLALGRKDGSKIYVLGPRGSGWTFGAFFNTVT